MKTVKIGTSNLCVKDIKKEKIDYKAINRSFLTGKCTVDDIANLIAEGYSFTPATFIGKRNKDNVEQMQLFALDFDSDKESGECSLDYNEALRRAKRFNLPIAISYETKSSHNYNRYRLLFLYNESVCDKRYMELICRLLLDVFPEADSTSSDISKFYLPGKSVKKISEDYFYLDMLVLAARTVTEERYKNTWKNRIHHLQNKTGIVCVGNDIYISAKMPENVHFSPITINTYMVLEPEWTEKVPDYNYENHKAYIFFSDNKEDLYIDSVPVKKSRFYQKDIPYDDCISRCRLFEEFVGGKRNLEHHEWFGLGTNLIYKNKGQTEFENALKEYPQFYDDIECKLEQIRYAVKNGYLPTRCENYCPYADECSHKTNALLTMKKDYNRYERLSSDTQYIELSELRFRLNQAVLSAVNGDRKNTVIKTQTGSGKTQAALNAVKQSKNRVIMAFSNTDLMNEVYNKAESMGIEAVKTPTVDEIYQYLSDDEVSAIQSMYNSGTEEMVNEYLREIANTNENIRGFLRELDKSMNYKGHIFTTHARLLTLGSSILENSVVIIDEDILPLMLSVKEAKIDDIKKFRDILRRNRFFGTADSINQILNSCKGKSKYFYSNPIELLRNDKRNFSGFISDTGSKIDTCVVGALESDYFYYSSINKSISFIVKHSLNQSYKSCIMLSATADRNIHTRLFENCDFIEYPYAKYKGELIQHYDKTYSRFYFQQDPEKLFRELTEKHSDCNFITFKKYVPYINADKSKIMYYGKSVGVNGFSGENSAVIGTPHKPEFVYHLTAFALGIDNEKDTLAMRQVEANGFRFYMMAFKNKELQEIQKYFIESDLEQAIGRARLLNNDCRVDVYSRYPAKQCILADEIIADYSSVTILKKNNLSYLTN